MKVDSAVASFWAPLQQRWAGLQPRERQGLIVAGALSVLALFWFVGVSPALQVLNKAPRHLAQMELQVQQMQHMAAQAKWLQELPRVSRSQALQLLQTATARLGHSASLSEQGDRVVLKVQELPAEALAQWLMEARSAARALPTEAELQRSGKGYSGSIYLNLGGQP
jgi:general secretion pathway protein M